MKTILASLFIIILTLFVAPATSYAWGKKGHEIVAEISFALLDSNTKKTVLKYLDNTTIEQASTWMDDMRGNHRYDYLKTWHYVNTEKGNEYVPTKEPNIINALTNAIDQLSHKDKLSDEDIKFNLLLIFHLCGDLHQPLHVGYEVDKGGNDIQVKYLGNPSNLHRVWDTEIIESEGINANQCLLLYKNFSKDEIAHFTEINPEKWMHQPRALLSSVYNFNHEDNSIDQAYVDKNKKIIEQQLLIAGMRLAAILRQSFQS
jgi:hypothetical protein